LVPLPHTEFRLIADAEHLQGAKSDPDGYRRGMRDLFKRALG
jgi:hypothetical protein